MTDAAVMDAFGDGEDIHFMIDVDSTGHGPLPKGSADFDHYACACGVDYYPCPRAPLDAEQVQGLGEWMGRLDEQAPGPWHVDPTVPSNSRPLDSYDVIDRYTEPILTNTTYATAQFIALSRTLVPQLVHQLQRVTAELERTKNAMRVLGEAMAEHEARLYPEGEGDTDEPEAIG